MKITVHPDGETPKEIAKELATLSKLLGGGVELGKPSKVAKPPVDEDDGLGLDGNNDDVVGIEDDPAAEEVATGPDVDDVRAALNKLAKKDGKAAAMKLLKKHGVSSVDDLKEKYYATIIKLAKV